MSDEVKREIERLAGEAHDKRVVREALGLCNASAEPDIARKNAIAYAVARSEETDARARLEAAIRKGEE